MQAASSGEAPEVLPPAPAAEAHTDSDEDALEPLPAKEPCHADTRRWSEQAEEHVAETAAA
eukprot:13674983-Alexandrium_andersonii.AAC.1